MGDILYLILVLLVVAAVLYLSYRFSKFLSRQSVRLGNGSYMRVVDRLPVGSDRYIIIVEIQKKYYLMSVTGQNIETIKELDDFVEDEPPEQGEKKPFTESFKTVLNDYMNRNKK